MADELLERDRKWIEKLSMESPESWQISDFEKSKLLIEDLHIEIDNT